MECYYIVIIGLILEIAHTITYSEGLSSETGLALETWHPCGDEFITMEREIGRPKDVEKYWNGTVNLFTYQSYIRHATVTLTLDNPAKVIMDSSVGRANYLNDRTYELVANGVPDNFTFRVQGSYSNEFPNIQEVELNGIKVCKKIMKWNATLLHGPKVTTQAPLLPRDFAVPFCGRKILDHTTLVTDGVATKPGDWPWHIALYYRPSPKTSSYRCGGSIITQNYIITAAHCITLRHNVIAPEKLSVSLGKYFLNVTDQNVVEIPISQVIRHGDYETNYHRNDIALLKLAFTIIYNQYIQPICMWNIYNIHKEDVFGMSGTVVGWGANEYDQLSEVLQLATLSIVSDTTCLISFQNFFKNFISDTTFCAGNGPKNGTSACNGDSGGGMAIPITLRDGRVSWFLRGIVSISVARSDKNICDPNHYIVFTDVAKYLPWIKDNTDLTN